VAPPADPAEEALAYLEVGTAHWHWEEPAEASWREHAAAAAVGLGAVDTVAAAAVAAAEELVQALGLAAAGGGPEEELGVGLHLMIVGFSACRAGFELGRERGSRRDW